jgi:mannose-6-phosphate isomerase-like protein (cupin superfamily)
VPAGKGTSRGVHIHDADQIYYILHGEMTAQLGEERYTARPGQLVFIPRGLPHWNWNEGSEPELHFELIVPPPARELVAQAADGSLPLPDVGGLELVRTLDEGKFDPERFSQVILADRSSRCNNVSFGVFRVPPGGSSPQLHVHRVDQVYFVISGTMSLQIGFEEYTAGPNSLVILPAGMPHRNWNAGTEPEYHINLRVPEPDPASGPWDLPVHIGSEEAR